METAVQQLKNKIAEQASERELIVSRVVAQVQADDKQRLRQLLNNASRDDGTIRLLDAMEAIELAYSNGGGQCTATR